MHFDEYDEEDDEEEKEPLLLGFENGVATLKKPSDFVELTKEDMEVLQSFIKTNQELFNKFLKEKYPHKL